MPNAPLTTEGNQDDHPKNVKILIGSDGDWTLSRAYDLTYAVEAGNQWLASHQMTVNGKSDDFARSDIWQIGHAADMDANQVDEVIDQVQTALAQWPDFASTAAVLDVHREINTTYRSL